MEWFNISYVCIIFVRIDSGINEEKLINMKNNDKWIGFMKIYVLMYACMYVTKT